MGSKPSIVPRKPGQSRSLDTGAAQRFLSEVKSDSDGPIGPSGSGSIDQPSSIKGEEDGREPLMAVPNEENPTVEEVRAEPPMPTPALGKPKGRLLTRSRTGTTVRQVTAYLPRALSKSLAHYCAEHDTDKNAVIVSAIEHFLTAVG